jgi:hypothetical protein
MLIFVSNSKTAKVIVSMYCVTEYGENIGTLKNLFREKKHACEFAQRIMGFSDQKYRCIGEDKWYCIEKNEFIRVTET